MAYFDEEQMMRTLPRPIQILLAILTLLTALYPILGEFLVGGMYDFVMQKLTSIMILAIMAVSLDLLVGVSGMISIAQAAFFGIAGYTLVLFAPSYEAASIWVVLPLSLATAALAALIMGLVIIRMSSVFFIMATIAFSEMLFYLFNSASFAGGSDGAFIFYRPEVAIGEFQLLNLDSRTTQFYVVLASLVGVTLLLRTFLRAPFGRVLLGIKENEMRVRSMGYNPVYYKLMAFVISGTIAGYAGVLSAIQYGVVHPENVSWFLSAQVLVMVILGGAGTLFGPILGAFAFEGMRYWFTMQTHNWALPMGIAVIAMVLCLRRGIGGLLVQLCDRTWERGKPVWHRRRSSHRQSGK